MIERISKTFNDKFGENALIVRSPGRVNIIGEHTDYNEGFVLPAAIDKAIYIAVSKRDDDEIHLNELFELQLQKKEMVQMAQKAEHLFAGVKVGIMDMFASMFGKAEHAIKLDCRSLEYEYVPLHLNKIKIVLFNTNVKHSLASSE